MDSKQHPILESEWLTVVHADSMLEVDTLSCSNRQTEKRSIERQHLVVWIGRPDRPCFFHNDGKISRKDLDDSTLKKMIQLACKLNARVIGDDAEEYDEVKGRIKVHEWTEP